MPTHHKISGCTRSIGKPAGWDEALDGPCGTLHVRDQIDITSGINFMQSLWKPTRDELAVLNGGGMILLSIAGAVHPVMSMEIVP